MQQQPRQILEISVQELVKDLNYYGLLRQAEFFSLLESAINIFRYEPNLIHLTSPIIVVGDIHGQFHDLLNIFQRNGYPPAKKYVFLGDYVDRGNYSIEVLTLLFWLKIKYPKAIYLLRGNHESRVLTSSHNFRNECKNKYNYKIYQLTTILFELLPLCCIVDSKYFCVHAGISPDLKTVSEIQKINRTVEIPQKGILCDLLWSDPIQEDRKDWSYNNNRSCSYFYSRKQTYAFLKENNLKMVIRGHEVQLKGFKYQEVSKSEKKYVLTVFSAPNYCDKYNNLGSVARISPDLISMDTFKFVDHPDSFLHINILDWSFSHLSKNVSKLFLTLMKASLINHEVKSLHKIKQKLTIESEIEVMKGIISSQQYFAKPQLQDPSSSDSKSKAFPTDNILSILKFMATKKMDIKLQAMPQIRFADQVVFSEETKEKVENQNLEEEKQAEQKQEKKEKKEKKEQAGRVMFGPKIWGFHKVSRVRSDDSVGIQ